MTFFALFMSLFYTAGVINEVNQLFTSRRLERSRLPSRAESSVIPSGAEGSAFLVIPSGVEGSVALVPSEAEGSAILAPFSLKKEWKTSHANKNAFASFSIPFFMSCRGPLSWREEARLSFRLLARDITSRSIDSTFLELVRNQRNIVIYAGRYSTSSSLRISFV